MRDWIFIGIMFELAIIAAQLSKIADALKELAL